jgi:hypothetical protein
MADGQHSGKSAAESGYLERENNQSGRFNRQRILSEGYPAFAQKMHCFPDSFPQSVHGYVLSILLK